MKEDLFKLSGQEIYKLVSDDVFKKLEEYRHQNIQRIMHWIKKRYIIEKIYEGKCVGCNNFIDGISIKENLPAFQFLNMRNFYLYHR